MNVSGIFIVTFLIKRRHMTKDSSNKKKKQFSGDLLKNQARQSTQMEVWGGTLVMSLSAARGFRGWTSKVEGCESATN